MWRLSNVEDAHHRGKTLRRGDIVMTGSALKTEFPKPGDRVTYRIEGLGETSVRVGK